VVVEERRREVLVVVVVVVKRIGFQQCFKNEELVKEGGMRNNGGALKL